MSRNGISKRAPNSCKHTRLCLNTSDHAAVAGYKRPTAQQRAAATTPSGHVKGPIKEVDPATFPAPLVLPNDDLDLDPHYPPQSLRSWIREKDRNEVTPDRRTIYVTAPPDIRSEVNFIREWSRPTVNVEEPHVQPPDVGGISRYLEAFYHPLPVKVLPPKQGLRFAAWEGENDSVMEISPEQFAQERTTKRKVKEKTKAKVDSEAKPIYTTPKHIALNTPTESIRIRTRPRAKGAPYSHQLNLNDVLDAALSILPSDAYALLLLVTQDLFEDDDDDFVCGRAYGGSRIAVVSMARYDPRLDEMQGVDELHGGWPVGGCEEFVRGRCREGDGEGGWGEEMGMGVMTRRRVRRNGEGDGQGMDGVERMAEGKREGGDFMYTDINHNEDSLFPLQAALAAYLSLPPHSTSKVPSASALSALWISRVSKCSSHELGHCLGLDHCVYYACVMQGSASVAEGERQPFYLCPVCESKVNRAVGTSTEERRAKMREYLAWAEAEKGTGCVREWRVWGAWLDAL